MHMPGHSGSSSGKIAEERISELFDFAEQLFTDEFFSRLPEERRQNYADRYVRLARKISMKMQIPIPQRYKKRFCRHCHTYLRPGINCRTRTRGGKLVTYCDNCKRFMRKELSKGDASGKGEDKEE